MILLFIACHRAQTPPERRWRPIHDLKMESCAPQVLLLTGSPIKAPNIWTSNIVQSILRLEQRAPASNSASNVSSAAMLYEWSLHPLFYLFCRFAWWQLSTSFVLLVPFSTKRSDSPVTGVAVRERKGKSSMTPTLIKCKWFLQEPKIVSIGQYPVPTLPALLLCCPACTYQTRPPTDCEYCILSDFIC